MPCICYQPKTFKRTSRLRIQQANEIIAEYAKQGFALTLRSLYYKFVARNLIPNSERSYDALGALISDARLAGLIDWNAIDDQTRHLRSNSHWDTPAEIVEACANQYRRDLWANQSYRPEVWIEKDAVLGVIEGICTELDVPYFSCRGYTSQSGMWRAGRRMIAHEKGGQKTLILHFGDHDPSGLDMTRDITDRMAMFGSSVEVRRIALTMEQIEQYQPPPNPAKVTDSRYDKYRDEYGDESWELDALEPSVIVGLIQGQIDGIRDDAEWEDSVADQEHEKEQLQKVSDKWDKITRKL